MILLFNLFSSDKFSDKQIFKLAALAKADNCGLFVQILLDLLT